MLPEPPFELVDHVAAAEAACRLFETVLPVLIAKLPPGVEIRHIGSTAIPGCLTKGDLDVVVRVEPLEFVTADAALAQLYPRNAGSCRTEFFSSFEDPESSPHLGIQLVSIGGPLDDFHRFSETLLGSPALVAEYNALKTRFHGAEMSAYRAAKDAFIGRILSAVGG